MRKAFLWLVLLTLVLFAQQENKISKGEFLRYEAYLNNSINLSQTHNSTEIIYKDDFSKLGGWFVISGWVMEGNSESERLLTTNKEINYKNNTSYLLESRDIILPNTTHKTKLMYREKFETESEYDFIKILVSSDNGKNWITVDSKSGISDWRESTVDLTTYMGKKIRLRFLMETDDSYSGKGWQIDDITIKTEVRSTLNIQIESLNSQNFPVIYTNVKVDSAGIGISTLTEENFSVYENGVLQTNLFEVIPPETGGGSRLADIVFVVDVSGSMGEEIAAVKANMTSFINALTAAEINFNIGLVTFADLYYVYNSGNLYSSTSQIFNVINAITLGEHGLGNGGDTPENQFGAMAAGADLNYRPGAQRIEIMITDAISHSGNHITPWTQSTLINDKLLPNNISVYPIFNTNAQDQRNQYIPIATATTTSGMYFNVYSNFNVIISEIGSLISDSYVIRYQSSNPNCTGDLRNVLIQVNYLGQTDTSSRSYTSCDLPIIERTTATKNLHNFAHPVGTSFSIDVDVVDNYSPYTNSVRLFYKSSGTSTFSSVSMNNISGTLWRGNIPGSVSVEPGVDYYITASDGITTVSDPKTEPGGYPYQIAILPNVAPVITHTPVTEAILNQPIDIVATIIDNTNFLSQQKLFYRKYGQIIYTEVSMVSTGGMVYLASIPGNMVTMDGVEYYISAWDDFGLRTDHGTRTEPHKIILSVIEADFRAEPTITQVNRNVQFTDLSIPSPTSWEWDFNNDGLTDSYEKNPVYQYLVPGIYTVKLRVSNWQTSSTVVKENFIQVMQLVGEQYYLHYPLDGNATDMSGNGHHAVLQGQTAAEDRFGGVGKALRFDLNYIESPFNFSSQISDTASYHVTLWFKADHIADMTVLGNSSVMPSTHAFLTTSNGGGVYAQINGGTFNGYGANPFDGGWHLITVGTDGNEIMWSVDTWSAGGTDWGSNSGQFLWLGNNQNPMFSLFKGVFDDLRIYKRKLNLTEILDIYNSGNAPEKCYLVYPSNASTEHPPNGLMFRWKKALENQKTILKYQFELATDYQFNNIIVNDSTLTDTTHTVNGLNYASTYYWRVRAKNQVGWGTWSDIWYFSTHSMSSFAIISPNGGENWTVGSTQNIVWNSSNSSDIEIHYTTDDGVSWSLIILSTPVASGSYSWIVPNTPSVNCRVKINEISGSMLSDISDMVFTISESSIGEPTIVFTTPDFTIRNPENDSTAGFGYSQFSENAKAIGRFNNDIYDDLVVVSPLYQNSAGIKVGKAYIYYGSATGLDTLNHHAVEGLYEVGSGDGWIGLKEIAVGDYNADGYDDLALAASSYNTSQPQGQGYALVFLSKADGNGLNISNPLQFIGPAGNNIYGQDMISADVNGDNIQDLIVSANYDAGYQGRIYVYYGGADFNTEHDKVLLSPGTIGLGSTTAGDINGDGYDDIIAWELPSWNIAYLNVHIFMGAANMSETPAFTRMIPNAYPIIAGDINNDGFADIFYSRNRYDNSTNGKLYCIKGASSFNINDEIVWDMGFDKVEPFLVSDFNRDNKNDISLNVKIADEWQSRIYSGDLNSYLLTSAELIRVQDNNISYGLDARYTLGGNVDGDAKNELYSFSRTGTYKDVVNIYNYSPLSTHANLIAHYTFDDNTNDLSGNNLHGQISGSVPFVTGKHGRAVQFNGNANNYVKVPHNNLLNFNGSFTITAWINSADTVTPSHVISKGRDIASAYSIGRGGKTISFNNSYGIGSGAYFPGSFPYNEWHFVAGVIDNETKTAKYYLNGVKKVELSWGSFSPEITTEYPLVFGRHFTDPNGSPYNYPYPFTGLLDEVRIFDKALTESEIVNLFGGSVEPSLHLLSPNGMESWTIGTTQRITWSSNSVASIKIELTTNGGDSWVLLNSNVSSGSGFYDWIVDFPSNSCRIRISDVNNPAVYDVSDNYFSIMYPLPAIPNLVSPPNNSLLNPTTANLEWTFAHWAQEYNVQISLDHDFNNIVVDTTLFPHSGNQTYQYWNLSDLTQYFWRVRAKNSTGFSNWSEIWNFTTKAASYLTILSPNGGEEWLQGSTQNILWESNIEDSLLIQYSTNNGANWIDIARVTSLSSPYHWEIPNNPSETCLIKITSLESLSIGDLSNSVLVQRELEFC